MKLTTITAKKAVKKKMVLIDFSLKRENRAFPADVAGVLRFRNNGFTIFPSKFLCSGSDRHVSFIGYDLLAVSSVFVLDEVASKS
jgi:hypothetical protein